jgi:hypothetical protein
MTARKPAIAISQAGGQAGLYSPPERENSPLLLPIQTLLEPRYFPVQGKKYT